MCSGKGPDSDYVRLCRPSAFCWNRVTADVVRKSQSELQAQGTAHSNKTLRTLSSECHFIPSVRAHFLLLLILFKSMQAFKTVENTLGQTKAGIGTVAFRP